MKDNIDCVRCYIKKDISKLLKEKCKENGVSISSYLEFVICKDLGINTDNNLCDINNIISEIKESIKNEEVGYTFSLIDHSKTLKNIEDKQLRAKICRQIVTLDIPEFTKTDIKSKARFYIKRK